MSYRDIVPYTCVYLDASWVDLLKAAERCTVGCDDRRQLIHSLQKLWTTTENPNSVMPCLSVRTALDLYFTVMAFPPGSEIIMSALNIPDMVRIVHHHKLKIVPLDMNIDTMEPKAELLEELVTEKTVALLLAHVYGKRFDMQPFIDRASKHKLRVIEDCAECFSGFSYLGHPDSDISMFSFGAIKFYTSFGGAIAKVKDPEVFSQMLDLYKKRPTQSTASYLYKILKYSMVYLLLNCPRFIKPAMYTFRTLGIDHKKKVVSMLRGFPEGLMEKIRQQPSTALLHMLHRRHTSVDAQDLGLSRIKGSYVTERISSSAVTPVGAKAPDNNYWLYPIIVENPEEVVRALNVLGIDAYRGATQLNIVEPSNNQWSHLQQFATHYPYETKYLVDHVIYLPVNKTVPFHELDRICQALDVAVNASSGSNLLPVSTKQRVKISSKL